MQLAEKVRLCLVSGILFSLICAGCGSSDDNGGLTSYYPFPQTVNNSDSPSPSPNTPTRLEALLQAIEDFVPGTGLVWKTISQRFSSNSIVYGNGRFVSVGYMGCVQSSIDGRNWTAVRAFDNEPLKKILFSSGQFLALSNNGRIFTSNDGIVWVQQSAQYFFGVWFENGRYFGILSNYTLVTSADGHSWETFQPLANKKIGAIAYRNGIFVATEAILLGGDIAGRIYRSVDDGQSWTESVVVPAQTRALGICANDSVFVILLSDNRVMVSSDGTNWQFAPATKPPSAEGVYLYYLQVANNRFFSFDNFSGTLVSSADGLNWDPISYPLEHKRGDSRASICFAQNQYVLGTGNGLLASSQNLTDWTVHRKDQIFDTFLSVAFGAGRFVAASEEHFSEGRTGLYSSLDGVRWESVALPPDLKDQFMDIVYSDGAFWAVGFYQNIIRSADGLTWTRIYNQDHPGSVIAVGAGKVVVLGGGGSLVRASDLSDSNCGCQSPNSQKSPDTACL